MMIELNEFPAQDLPAAYLTQVFALECQVWPQETAGQDLLQLHHQRCTERARRRVFLLLEDHQVIAHAETFERLIYLGRTPLMVACLASVCVQPQCQRQGLGRRLVRQTLTLVDGGHYPVMLFQTDSDRFYRYLGCRSVNNRFVNRRAADVAANPWHGRFVMIYPATHPWTDETVDLNGPGF
ncbi:MAG: hypothetical protein Tsb002_14680 [Wenzhouxiangellaceae bacterium]